MSSNATQKISRAEVAKHNKPDDAWIIIDDKGAYICARACVPRMRQHSSASQRVDELTSNRAAPAAPRIQF